MLRLTRRRTFKSAVFLCLCLLPPLTGAAQNSRTATFCSYNVKNWLLQHSSQPDTQPPFHKSDSEKRRVIEFLTQIRPDILGLCEIGLPSDLAEIQALLRAAGIDLPHSEMAGGGDPTRALGLLSRFPITSRNSQTDLHYQMGRQTLPMQRGILDVTIDLRPKFAVRFVGVHLKSKRAIAEADESMMRRNEAHLLRRHLDSIFAATPDARVVCYGDFNEHRNSPAIAEIIGSRASPGHMADVYLRDEAGLVWTHFWDEADVYSRFDYLFVSRIMRTYVDSGNCHIFSAADFHRASDHRPVVLALKKLPPLIPATPNPASAPAAVEAPASAQ